AVRIAANVAKKMLFEIAAEKLNADPASLESKDGFIFVKGSPDVRISAGEAAVVSQWGKGKPILASGVYNPPNTDLDPETGQGSPFPTYCYATQIVDIEVDTETGEVKMLKVYSAHDVGKAIHPSLALGQIYGGVIMGLSYGMMEEMEIDDKGKVLNPNFGGYYIATTEDVPQIEPIIVEKHEPMGPFGAKSLGEPPHICMSPAIINAIYDAVGVRIDSLPVTPEKVLNALKEKVKGKAKPKPKAAAKPAVKKRKKK
ncbi:MAG: xanthine dehydrogenase family protein molybdopterin-binding subunit, partial [Candidatus Bathyarchaeia archaeon]